MRLLLVEDDFKLSRNLSKILKRESYNVDAAETKAEAEEAIFSHVYDLIILDINLPDDSGINFCKEVRESSITTPILILTANSSTSDKVEGFNVGADDYLTKPFEISELLVRIKALLRRKTFDLNILKSDNLTLDPNKRLVKRDNKEIALSNKEYALLEYLLRNKDRINTKSEIINSVWGKDYDLETNVVDVYIGYIRKKIDKNFTDCSPLIRTIRGMGYKIG